MVGVTAGGGREVDVEDYEGGVVNCDSYGLSFQIGVGDEICGQGSKWDGLVDDESQAAATGRSVLLEEVVSGDTDSRRFWAQFGFLQGRYLDLMVEQVVTDLVE